MVETNTVFILGAGASKPYGFPTALELKEDLIKHSQTYLTSLDYNQLGHDASHLKLVETVVNSFTGRFNLSKIFSIDKFLNTNRDLAEIGKIALTICLNKYERLSMEKMGKVGFSDWFEYLINNFLLSDIHSIDDVELFETNRITFITFNYDRSLEYLLWTFLSNHFFNVERHVLTKMYSSIKIYHVYGMLGDILESSARSGFLNAYGGISSLGRASEISGNIKTIYERVDVEKSTLMEIIEQANSLLFLGFGFAEENVKALGLDEINSSITNIVSTAFGVTPNECHRARQRLSISFRDMEFGYNLNCLDLLRNHL